MIGSIQGGSTAIGQSFLKRQFKSMDANGDGGLDQTELAGMAKRTGKDAASLLAGLDTDKDGKVSASELEADRAKHQQEAGQSQGAGMEQITTALMNILKQLQGSQGTGGDQAGGGGCGQDGADASVDAQSQVQSQGVKGQGHHRHSLEDMFKKMDANGDGSLDQSELGDIAAKTGKDASQVLTDMDSNGDGKVSSSELQADAAKRRQEREQERSGNGSQPDPKNPIAEITTTLMNILKQLQESQNTNGDTGSSAASTSASPAQVQA